MNLRAMPLIEHPTALDTMFLQTHDNWEICDLFFQALDPPGTRRYTMMEIALSLPLFLLEAAASPDSDNEPVLWQEFLLTKFDDVQDFLSSNELEDYRLSLLLPRYMNKTYEFTISTVTEVYTGTVPDDRRCNLFVCTDGRHFLDASGTWQEKDLIDKALVYKRDKPVAPERLEDWADLDDEP